MKCKGTLVCVQVRLAGAYALTVYDLHPSPHTHIPNYPKVL